MNLVKAGRLEKEMPIFANNFFVGNTQIEANGHMLTNSNILIDPLEIKRHAPLKSVAPPHNDKFKKENDQGILLGSHNSSYLNDMLLPDKE
jgi:hypothetical protein